MQARKIVKILNDVDIRFNAQSILHPFFSHLIVFPFFYLVCLVHRI